jgi:hypothetical protein
VDEPPLAPQPSAAAVPDGQRLPLLIQEMRAGLDARFQQHLARLQRLPPELREDYFQLSVVVPEEGPLIVDGEAADLRRQLGHLNAIGQAMSLWEDLLAKVERSLIQERRGRAVPAVRCACAMSAAGAARGFPGLGRIGPDRGAINS